MAASGRAAGAAFTAAERRIIRPLPHAGGGAGVPQRGCRTTPSRRRAARRCAASAASCGTARAHCLEAALAAAVILEQHGYPPLVLSFESIDELDHVLFVYRQRGRWGSIARSRDPGLHGRKPVFRTRARARAQLRRAVRRLHRPHHRLHGRRSARPARRTTTGGCRRTTSGRRSACCSTRRTARSGRQTRASTRCGGATSAFRKDARRSQAALLPRSPHAGRRCRRETGRSGIG